MRKILLLLSDTHGGSAVGLCHPEARLWDKEAGRGGYRRPSLSRTQHLLWQDYDAHLLRAREIAGGDRVIVAHLGDATDGNVFLHDVREARFLDQYQIARWNLSRIFEVFGAQLESMVLLDGTNVHTFEGSSEYVLADLLRETYGVPVWCYPHLVLTIGQTTHDLAHHGPRPGTRVWSKGSAASSWLQSHMMREIMAGRRPSTCVYRGHWHEYAAPITQRVPVFGDGAVETVESNFLFVPGYSGLSDHARKATQSEGLVTWGMIAVEIVDGRLLKFHPLVAAHDTRLREEVAGG